MDNLAKFCFFTPLKIFFISIPLSVINIVFVGILIAPQGRYLEIDMEWGFIFLAVLLSLCLSFGLFMTLFLNYIDRIRNNIFFSAITFYWAVIIAIYLLGSIGINMQAPDIFLSLLLPFLIPLTVYFIRFRIKLKRGYFNDEEENDE